MKGVDNSWPKTEDSVLNAKTNTSKVGYNFGGNCYRTAYHYKGVQ